jgi:hypothetical protein
MGPAHDEDPLRPDHNEIVMQMTSHLSNIRFARLVAAGLATQAGLDVDEMDDLRIAIDEVCASLLAAGAIGSFAVRFQVDPGTVLIEAQADVTTPPTELPRVTREILNGSASEWRHTITGATLRFAVDVRSRPAVQLRREQFGSH